MKRNSEEEQGIKAIIYLQAMAGIEEPREKALAGWRGMSKRERVFTLEFYQQMSKDSKKHEDPHTKAVAG